MPFDPNELPSLLGDYETPQEKLKRQLDELAGLLGPGFSYKNGLHYQGDKLSARINNKGLSMKYPLMGGTLSGSITDIGQDPYYQLKYIKAFK